MLVHVVLANPIMLLIKRRGEMQLSNPARISRAIPVAING